MSYPEHITDLDCWRCGRSVRAWRDLVGGEVVTQCVAGHVLARHKRRREPGEPSPALALRDVFQGGGSEPLPVVSGVRNRS